jgi:hypothetical protein
MKFTNTLYGQNTGSSKVKAGVSMGRRITLRWIIRKWDVGV